MLSTTVATAATGRLVSTIAFLFNIFGSGAKIVSNSPSGTNIDPLFERAAGPLGVLSSK